MFYNEEKKQQAQSQQEEPKEEQQKQNTDQQQQSDETPKKSYFKKLLSPANLILPAVFGIILYNFAKYDVRQKKREAELDSKFRKIFWKYSKLLRTAYFHYLMKLF